MHVCHNGNIVEDHLRRWQLQVVQGEERCVGTTKIFLSGKTSKIDIRAFFTCCWSRWSESVMSPNSLTGLNNFLSARAAPLQGMALGPPNILSHLLGGKP